jgi:hypothetical protein
MKMKIALAAFACSGTLLALLPTSASAAPVSGVGQSHGIAAVDNPLLQKVHRWWRRGWGGGPYYGYGYGHGYGYGYPYYRPYYPAYRAYYYAPPPPPPPPPYYYYRPYWGPYY